MSGRPNGLGSALAGQAGSGPGLRPRRACAPAGAAPSGPAPPPRTNPPAALPRHVTSFTPAARSNRNRDLPGSSLADTDLLSISAYGDIAFRLNRMSSGTTVCPMEDPEVVAAIVAGDPAGLAEAYDRYALPLYTYCRSMLHEPADAADAVQDTFLVATAKLRDLRDPARLRPWLYAVARNECFRRLRAGKALSALDEAPDIPATRAEIGATAEQAELSQLSRAAMDGLNPGERDVIELSLISELDNDELADALGVSRNHAHALLSRARSQLERSLGALIVARTGRHACAELDGMLKSWDGQLTVLMRKRISRHIEQCEVCGERKRRE